MIKYHAPIAEVYDFLGKFITKGMKVLELGPGVLPFPYATHFCGWLDSEREKLSNYKVVDFSKDKFYIDYASRIGENVFHRNDALSAMSVDVFKKAISEGIITNAIPKSDWQF